MMKTPYLGPTLGNRFIFGLLALLAPMQVLAGAGLTYHGRLLDPSGEPVVGSAVQFKIQLRTPGPENCLMYEEVQVKDLSQSSGVFSVTINDGTGTRLDSSGYGIDQVFANRTAFSFAASACATGTVYNPSPADGRKIQVLFNDGRYASGQWEPAPPMAVNFVPSSIETLQIGGYKKEQLLKVADGVSQTGTELNATSWASLLGLIAGTSALYVKPTDPINQLSGATLPAPANGQSLRWNSALNAGAGGWENFTAGASTSVTSVSSTNSDISIANGTTTPALTVNSGTGANQLVKLDGTSKLPAVDGSALTNVNAAKLSGIPLSIAAPVNGQVIKYNGTNWVNASDADTLGGLACAAGQVAYYYAGAWTCLTAASANTLGALVARDASGNFDANQANLGSLKINNGSGGTATLSVPAAFTSYQLKLPTSVGTAGQVLVTDGATPANLSWTSVSGGLPAAAGTAAAPGYAFSGNTNTGMFGAATNQIGFSTNGAERLRIDASGNVGIGTSSPSAALDVQRTVTGTTGANGSRNYLSANPSTNSTGWYVGQSTGVETTGAVNYAGKIIGSYNEAVNWSIDSPKTIGEMIGTYGYVQNDRTAPVTSLKGVYSYALSNHVSGTATNIYGLDALAENYSNATNAYGVAANVLHGNSGTGITNAYGIYSKVTKTSGAITNGYGIYLGNIQATNKFSVYASDLTAPSYFAGNVGIGTTAPGSALDVKGTLRLSGSSSGYVGFAPAAVAGSTTYTLPAADGSSGQFLSTNGSGVLSWGSPAGGGTVTNVSSANADIAVATGGSTPVLTLNSGTGANQIVKLTAASKLPAVDGSLLTGITASQVSGVMPVANGGTNSSTALSNNRMMVSSGGAIVEAAAMTDGQIVVGKTGSAPQQVAMSGDASVTNTGAVTVSKIQNRTVASTAPSLGSVMKWNNTLSQWEPTVQASCSGAAQVMHYNSITDVWSCDTMSADTLLPSQTGNSGKVLTTDGSTTSWTTVSGGSLPAAAGTAGAPAYAFSGNTSTGMFGAATNQIGLSTNGTERLRIDANGNVGIGTTSPQVKLHVQTVANPSSIRLSDGGGTPGATGNSIDFYNYGDANANGGFFQSRIESRSSSSSGNGTADLVFSVKNSNADNSPSEKLRIAAGGNVGIGTSTPQGKLDVQGMTSIINGAGDALVIGADNLAQTQTFNTVKYARVSMPVYASSSGTPDTSTMLLGISSSTDNIVYLGGGGSNRSATNLIFYTAPGLFSSGVERMRVEKTGNVGIGTTAPGSALDVKGTLRLSGATSGYVGFAPAAAAGSTTYTLPAADGSSGQFLSTNGSGVLSWGSPAGGGTVTNVSSANADIAVATGGSTPVLTLNSGTGANQIVKLTAASKLPAVDGSLLTGITASQVSGVMPVANGGTNSSTALSNNRMMVSSGGAIVEAAAMTDGQIVVGKTGSAPQQVAMSGDASVTNTGVVTVSKIQNRTVASTAPSLGSVMKWNNTLSQWEPTVQASCSGASQVMHYNSITDVWSCDTMSADSLLPTQTGNSGKVLTTDGSTTSWTTVSGGSLPAAAGTAGAPAYAFSGNTNTGVFGAATNQVGISTNGTERVRVDATGNMGVGVTAPTAKLQVAGQIVSNQNVIGSGATVDFATGNVQILQAPGGTAITLNNMVDGGSYTVIVTDTTSRMYTFTNCTNPHFVPGNDVTTSGSRTIYTILKTTESSATHCYISWITGF